MKDVSICSHSRETVAAFIYRFTVAMSSHSLLAEHSKFRH